MMRLVVLLAVTAPASSFKLPWSRSAAAQKSGGYQLGDISKVSRVPLSTPSTRRLKSSCAGRLPDLEGPEGRQGAEAGRIWASEI